MKKKQVYNPFLPLDEYIPDGEPHVFGNRVYLYGSHDKEGGSTFCMRDYVVYSAPVDDLTDWRYEGVSYKASQDPDYPHPQYMYAPDVVQGNDGRYYLYYCMGGDYGYGGYTGHIRVAVSNCPAGPFDYLGNVKYPDGTLMKKYICFDPAVCNDKGVIRLYYGTQYDYEERENFSEHPEYLEEEIKMFGKTKEEIMAYWENEDTCPDAVSGDRDSINGAVMVVLEDDMLTVKEEPVHIIPYRVKNTSFEDHPFFEGASMRKVGDKYYFIYSSWLNHELCYAVSDFPDRGFQFGGTIVSNGDVGFKGVPVEKKRNMTGTTHGSIVEIQGQWYVFYHRLTHKSDYSRQACAEKIYFNEKGHIPQVEVTSCGLNPEPLKAEAGFTYPAVIACNITNGHMPHGSNSIYQIPFPNVTHLGQDRFIGEIEEGTVIGFKYFVWNEISKLSLTARIETDENKVVYQGPLRIDERCEEEIAKSTSIADVSVEEDLAGYFLVYIDEQGPAVGKIPIPNNGPERVAEDLLWQTYEDLVKIPDGIYPLYLIYHGEKKVQLKKITFL